jgi:periplasmic divalent cation tolerance protein
MSLVTEKAVLIMVTAGGRDDAERIGEGLVVERLAACCNVVPTIASFYYWEGQLQREHESLLMIKTLESKAKAVEDYVRTHHTYEMPEVIQVPIEGGSSAYLDWLAGEVAKPSR